MADLKVFLVQKVLVKNFHESISSSSKLAMYLIMKICLHINNKTA